MKRLIAYLIIIFSFFINTNSYAKIGKGDLNISDKVLEYLIEYLRNEFSTSFVISKDGSFGYFGVCPSGKCSGGPGATSTLLRKCKKETGEKCYIFAQTKNKQKVIRWNKIDYKFPEGDFRYNASLKNPTPRRQGIKKSITDNDIIELLSKYNFIEESSSVAKKSNISEEIKPAVVKEEIYFACLNIMIEDRSVGVEKIKSGEEFGFQYFKLNSDKSEITVHSQTYDSKPEKIGSVKVDYQGKKNVEFEIRQEDGNTIISDKFNLSSNGNFYKNEGYDNYTFLATTYVKSGSQILDYDFRSDMCIPPKDQKKEKTIYKKWTKKGF